MKLLPILFLLLAGCAQVTAIRITDENPVPRGLPVYGFKPILVVSGSSAEVKVIPNLAERYALQLNTFLAKNHAKVDIRDNGTVAMIDANMDGTAIITFFEKALDKIPVGDTRSGALASQGEVAVYEFVFLPDGGLSLKKLGYSSMGFSHPPQAAAVAAAGGDQTGDKGGSVQPVSN